ncbi:MAG: hypothetical protein ACREJB_14365 [Planctomycetaceae bacterium]
MSTTEHHVYPPDVRADLEAVIDHLATGKPLDPELVRRVRERSEQAREEIRQKFGVQEIGVQIIREMRDAE